MKKFVKYLVSGALFLGGAVALFVSPLTMGLTIIFSLVMMAGLIGIVSFMVHDSKNNVIGLVEDEEAEDVLLNQEENDERNVEKGKANDNAVHLDIGPRWPGDDELRILVNGQEAKNEDEHNEMER